MHPTMRFLLLILLTLFTWVQSSFSQSNLDFEMSYFEDINSEYSFESIQNQKFQLVPEHVVNLGITKSTVWVKVNVKGNNLPPQAVFEMTNHYCDSVTISYDLKNNKNIRETLGIFYPHSKNKLHHYLPAFEIPTNQLASPDIYFKVNSRWSMIVSVKAKSKEAFNNDRVTTYLIAGLLIGGMLLMGIYNLFLYFSTRDFSYILYVLALLGAVLSQGYIYGFLIPYLSPESPEFSLRFPIIIMAFTGLFSCWFTIRFLEIKKTSKTFYYLLMFGIAFSLFSISLELLKLDYLSRIVNITEVIGLSIIIFSSALYSLIKGNKIALYFTIAWSFYLAGIIVFALKTVDIIPHNDFTKYFMHIGTFMEVILLSFALGHKYSLVRQEKERLERQTREELELLVRSKTAELNASLGEKEILLKEIHHRVKNNLQIVISLLDLQVATTKDDKNKEALSQSKARVYSMSLIHQKLYQSDNMEHVSMKSYLEELIEYIERSNHIESRKVNFSLNIEDTELSITKAVPLGLIVNELLTNSFKHGFQEKRENVLHLSLEFRDENLVLTVADSGLGFDEQVHTGTLKKSLGLFLVKSLTKQLRGTIVRYYREGLFATELTINTKER